MRPTPAKNQKVAKPLTCAYGSIWIVECSPMKPCPQCRAEFHRFDKEIFGHVADGRTPSQEN